MISIPSMIVKITVHVADMTAHAVILMVRSQRQLCQRILHWSVVQMKSRLSMFQVCNQPDRFMMTINVIADIVLALSLLFQCRCICPHLRSFIKYPIPGSLCLSVRHF